MEALGINPSFILVSAIGFLLLFLVLKKFAFGPIFGMLEQRQNNIRHNLDEAQARHDEMLRLQRDYQERLASIEDEARDKIQAAVREAQSARDEIIARAHADSQTIVQRGQEDMERERQKALAEMRNQIADLAYAMAGRVVKGNLNGQNQAQLIDEVIAGIGRNGQGAPHNGAGGA